MDPIVLLAPDNINWIEATEDYVGIHIMGENRN